MIPPYTPTSCTFQADSLLQKSWVTDGLPRFTERKPRSMIVSLDASSSSRTVRSMRWSRTTSSSPLTPLTRISTTSSPTQWIRCLLLVCRRRLTPRGSGQSSFSWRFRTRNYRSVASTANCILKWMDFVSTALEWLMLLSTLVSNILLASSTSLVLPPCHTASLPSLNPVWHM
jgi:hypothetical protein